MTTIIEKKSSGESSAMSAMAMVLIVCVLVAFGVGVVAYMNGSFSSPPTVIERNNTTTVEHKTIVVPAAEPAK